MSPPPPDPRPDRSTAEPKPEQPAPAEPGAAETKATPSAAGSRAARQLKRALVSVTVLVVTGLIGWATNYLPTSFFERQDDRPPLAVNVARGGPVLAEAGWDDCRGYVVPREPSTIPPPPPLNTGIAEARRRWAEALGGGDAGKTLIVATVQGRSPRSVVLTQLRVRIIERRPAPRGATISAPCGGPLNVRWVEVDLDRTPPRIVGSHLPDAPVDRKRLTPVRFPYVVSDVDPEQFAIYASTEDCDCTWTAELHWVDQGRSGVTPIDDGGKPFRTIATRNAPAFTSGHGEKLVRVQDP